MKALRRLVVVGADGQLGWELQRALLPLGEVVPLCRRDLDLRDLRAIEQVIAALHPTIVFNAAAYTAVDQAETNEAEAWRVNADAPRSMAAAASRVHAALVHFSTDYVFDGTCPRPYSEDDVPNPLNAYGRSKLAGERALAESDAACLTIRTSWLFSTRGHNFVRTILRLIHDRDEVRVVNDQFGSPTWARWLAEAVGAIAGRVLNATVDAGAAVRAMGGTLHLCSGGVTTWHGLAEAVLAADPEQGGQRCRSIIPVKTEEYEGSAAQRPARAVLDTSAALHRYGINPTPWQLQLSLALSP